MIYYILTARDGFGFKAFKTRAEAEAEKKSWEEEDKLAKRSDKYTIERTDADGYWLAFQKQWEKEEKR